MTPYWNPLVEEGLAAARRLAELRDYRAYRGKRQPTLVGVGCQRVRDWLAAAAKNADITVAGRAPWPHLLRATFCTHLVAAGVHPEIIRQLMNWNDLGPIQRYSSVANPAKREAVGRALLGGKIA